ncbi:hypothetical protein BTHE68_71430 (plasmid) [Burkholderia sp. THE68]|nr:hypothetical protein [Burkholderia sp. THE68]BBU33409.1 hypothetical protein BTHE68_71430 [Burkholderia sp. THE68]
MKNDLMKYVRSLRLHVFVLAALLTVFWFWKNDPDGGADTLMRLQ